MVEGPAWIRSGRANANDTQCCGAGRVSLAMAVVLGFVLVSDVRGLAWWRSGGKKCGKKRRWSRPGPVRPTRSWPLRRANPKLSNIVANIQVYEDWGSQYVSILILVQVPADLWHLQALFDLPKMSKTVKIANKIVKNWHICQKMSFF